MRRTTRFAWPMLVAGLVLSGAVVRAEDKVEVTVVPYQGLADKIKALRGKVVLVDFWATFCVPCKKKFPHQVEMYRKYAKDGLAVVSVSIDYAADYGNMAPEQKAKIDTAVLKFLKAQKATFTNLILNEPAEVLDKKLHFAEVPTVFVFNRQGKWTQFRAEGDKDVDPKAIEALVVALLKQK